MREISLGAIAAMLIATVAIGQPPGKDAAPPGDKGAIAAPRKPLDLEQLIALAISHSAEVQVADAKRREAEGELQRMRVSVIQRVIDLTSTIETQRNQLSFAEAGLAKATKLRQNGTLSEDEFRQAIKQVADAKAVLARSEAQLELLTGGGPGRQFMLEAVIGVPLGGGGGIGIGGGAGDPDARPSRPPSPAMADKIRKALDAPMKSVDFETTELRSILDHYRALSGVPFVVALGDRSTEPISLKLDKELPLGAHLQALQDLAPGLHITVRDYGLLFTFDTMPDDGMSYLNFWQGKPQK